MAAFGHCRPTRRHRTRGVGRPRRHHRADPARYARRSPRAQVLALDVLTERGDARPGTVLISGTISMLHGVNQFADTWKVAMTDPATQDVIGVEYQTVRMPESIG